VVSGVILTPREQVATGVMPGSGVAEPAETNTEVTDTPARIRVSYVTTLTATAAPSVRAVRLYSLKPEDPQLHLLGSIGDEDDGGRHL
jgi:hypothetical protein